MAGWAAKLDYVLVIRQSLLRTWNSNGVFAFWTPTDPTAISVGDGIALVTVCASKPNHEPTT
jgi:hypothetical protein